jgi:glucokinase
MSHTDLGIEASSPAGSKYFLIGDIGGTNSRMELKDSNRQVIKRLDTNTAHFTSFAELLTHFFEGLNVEKGKVFGSVSFASKISHNKTITNANYSWAPTDGNLIKEQFGFKDMVLLNDFEACGYSVPILDITKIVPLTGGHLPSFTGNLKLMLIGPGTGLGVCLLSQK